MSEEKEKDNKLCPFLKKIYKYNTEHIEEFQYCIGEQCMAYDKYFRNRCKLITT